MKLPFYVILASPSWVPLLGTNTKGEAVLWALPISVGDQEEPRE